MYVQIGKDWTGLISFFWRSNYIPKKFWIPLKGHYINAGNCQQTNDWSMVYGNMIIPLKMFRLHLNSFISVSAVQDIRWQQIR